MDNSDPEQSKLNNNYDTIAHYNDVFFLFYVQSNDILFSKGGKIYNGRTK